jgi:hypothetical protein
MSVLLMASALRNELPSVVFEQSDELAELHLPIVAGLSAGPCPAESGERERRASNDNLAVGVQPVAIVVTGRWKFDIGRWKSDYELSEVSEFTISSSAETAVVSGSHAWSVSAYPIPR